MPSHFNRAKPLILLSSIIFCSASPQETFRNCQCSLPCDGAPQLKKHDYVIISIVPSLQKDPAKLYKVSSLYNGEHCSVQGCFQSDTQYALKIYAFDNNPVPEILANKINLLPVCGPESMSDRKNPNVADQKLSNKILILLAFGFWLMFHLEEPR